MNKIADLHWGDSPGDCPNIAEARMVGPEPPQGHAAHLTDAQLRMCSPTACNPMAWPWKNYERFP
eukprot:3346959-Heterocapsa_arctica.AAC.1